MTDPIRTALEAAAFAYFEHERRKHPLIYTFSWSDIDNADKAAEAQRAAAAVAAFLRALPACDVMMERNSWEGGPHSTHALAAAVERAAQEASDGR